MSQGRNQLRRQGDRGSPRRRFDHRRHWIPGLGCEHRDRVRLRQVRQRRDIHGIREDDVCIWSRPRTHQVPLERRSTQEDRVHPVLRIKVREERLEEVLLVSVLYVRYQAGNDHEGARRRSGRHLLHGYQVIRKGVRGIHPQRRGRVRHQHAQVRTCLQHRGERRQDPHRQLH